MITDKYASSKRKWKSFFHPLNICTSSGSLQPCVVPLVWSQFYTRYGNDDRTSKRLVSVTSRNQHHIENRVTQQWCGARTSISALSPLRKCCQSNWRTWQSLCPKENNSEMCLLCNLRERNITKWGSTVQIYPLQQAGQFAIHCEERHPPPSAHQNCDSPQSWPSASRTSVCHCTT